MRLVKHFNCTNILRTCKSRLRRASDRPDLVGDGHERGGVSACVLHVRDGGPLAGRRVELGALEAGDGAAAEQEAILVAGSIVAYTVANSSVMNLRRSLRVPESRVGHGRRRENRRQVGVDLGDAGSCVKVEDVVNCG